MSSDNVKSKWTCRDLIYIGISVPVSLIIFIVGKIYSRLTNHNGKKVIYDRVKVIQNKK